jgi:hypothetical protein
LANDFQIVFKRFQTGLAATAAATVPQKPLATPGVEILLLTGGCDTQQRLTISSCAFQSFSNGFQTDLAATAAATNSAAKPSDLVLEISATNWPICDATIT